MKNVLYSLLAFIMLVSVMVLGLKAEQNEIKNCQLVQDTNDGKPYTNFNEGFLNV